MCDCGELLSQMLRGSPFAIAIKVSHAGQEKSSGRGLCKFFALPEPIFPGIQEKIQVLGDKFSPMKKTAHRDSRSYESWKETESGNKKVAYLYNKRQPFYP